MIKNTFKHSIRALKRQKGYVLINIIGLSVGIACSLLIALFVIHEFSYDKFHEKKDRIYRVSSNVKFGEQEFYTAYTSSPLGPAMKQDLPEVEEFCRMNMNVGSKVEVSYDEKNIIEDAFVAADSSFFKIFSILLIKGNINTVLNAPHTLVVSESAAKKYFGDENPIGKMLKIASDSTLYKVTGVMEDIPGNSHIEANIIGSFISNPNWVNQNWGSDNFSTYVLLKENASAEDVNSKFYAIMVK